MLISTSYEHWHLSLKEATNKNVLQMVKQNKTKNSQPILYC